MISVVLISGICIAGAHGRPIESPLGAGRVQAQAGTVDPSRREAAYRESNLGVAYLEQFRQEDAVKAFRREWHAWLCGDWRRQFRRQQSG